MLSYSLTKIHMTRQADGLAGRKFTPQFYMILSKKLFCRKDCKNVVQALALKKRDYLMLPDEDSLIREMHMNNNFSPCDLCKPTNGDLKYYKCLRCKDLVYWKVETDRKVRRPCLCGAVVVFFNNGIFDVDGDRRDYVLLDLSKRPK